MNVEIISKERNENVSILSFDIAQDNRSKCFLSGNKISKGEKIVKIISGGSKFSSRNYRKIKYNLFKKEILNFIKKVDNL